MEIEILNMLKDEKEVTWQTLLYDIIKKEGMDPWDINVSKLARLYIKEIKRLKKFDLKLSGKVILTAAILLKVKSTKLLNEDIQELDRIFSSIQEAEVEEINDFDEFYNGLSLSINENKSVIENIPKLIPRTPQPRKRKVSIYDLMDALEKALEVKERRRIRREVTINFSMPKKSVDISSLIEKVYNKILSFFKVKDRKLVSFNELVGSDNKKEKVFTFIPLLHLAHQDENKIELEQKEPFGDIEIYLYRKNAREEVEQEL